MRHKQGVAAEADFTNWLERRDGAALARVFDAIGGRLLLLAAHLAPRDVDARDLVLATFVAAMAHGGTWDRLRPLWPWLATILHNEARMHQRRRRRHREVELGDDVEPRAVAADPASVVAADEAFAAVLAAIDAMPLHYRQVLRLRLVHGLQPIEIAQTMEIPVGTVRAQLHRGLAQLRGSLPAGIATALAALLVGDGALLAQARAFVLQHATGMTVVGSATTAASAWLFSGALAMNTKQLIGITIGLALAAWLAFAFVWPESSTPDASNSPASPVASTARAVPTDQPAAAIEIGRNERVEPDAAVATDCSLTVRVLDPAGKPIPDAAVSVWTAPESGSFWNRSDSDYLRVDVAQGSTDARGEFHDPLVRIRGRSAIWRATHWVYAEARLANARPRRDLVQLPAAPTASPLVVTLELRPTNGIVGRVLDAHSQPIANAQIGDERSIADGTF